MLIPLFRNVVKIEQVSDSQLAVKREKLQAVTLEMPPSGLRPRIIEVPCVAPRMSQKPCLAKYFGDWFAVATIM